MSTYRSKECTVCVYIYIYVVYNTLSFCVTLKSVLYVCCVRVCLRFAGPTAYAISVFALRAHKKRIRQRVRERERARIIDMCNVAAHRRWRRTRIEWNEWGSSARAGTLELLLSMGTTISSSFFFIAFTKHREQLNS